MPQLVYIWIGDKLPDWALTAIDLSSHYCGVDVALIACREVARKAPFVKTYCLEDFYEREQGFEKLFSQDAIAFRDGFWLKTLERFLVLRNFMEAYAIDKVFHAELDNMIFDVRELSSILDPIGKGFFCPRDSVQRGIGSLIYVNDISRLQHMNEWFRDNHGLVKNEMELLGHMLAHEPGYFSLPNETALRKSGIKPWPFLEQEQTKGIFDAAALGQYLFGIDPKNARGVLFNKFVNENALVDFSELRFRFDQNRKTMLVRLEKNGEWTRCYNVHVHSKIFRKIRKASWFSHVLDTINQGQKTLICLNVFNWTLFRSTPEKLAKMARKLKRSFKRVFCRVML